MVTWTDSLLPVAGLLLPQVEVLHHRRHPVHPHPCHHLRSNITISPHHYCSYLKTAVELLVLIELLVCQPAKNQYHQNHLTNVIIATLVIVMT